MQSLQQNFRIKKIIQRNLLIEFFADAAYFDKLQLLLFYISRPSRRFLIKNYRLITKLSEKNKQANPISMHHSDLLFGQFQDHLLLQRRITENRLAVTIFEPNSLLRLNNIANFKGRLQVHSVILNPRSIYSNRFPQNFAECFSNIGVQQLKIASDHINSREFVLKNIISTEKSKEGTINPIKYLEKLTIHFEHYRNNSNLFQNFDLIDKLKIIYDPTLNNDHLQSFAKEFRKDGLKELIIEKQSFKIEDLLSICTRDVYHTKFIVQNENNFFELIAMEDEIAFSRSKYMCKKDIKIQYSGKFTRNNVTELKIYLRIPEKKKHIEILPQYELIGYETVINNPFVQQIRLDIFGISENNLNAIEYIIRACINAQKLEVYSSFTGMKFPVEKVVREGILALPFSQIRSLVIKDDIDHTFLHTLVKLLRQNLLDLEFSLQGIIKYDYITPIFELIPEKQLKTFSLLRNEINTLNEKFFKDCVFRFTNLVTLQIHQMRENMIAYFCTYFYERLPNVRNLLLAFYFELKYTNTLITFLEKDQKLRKVSIGAKFTKDVLWQILKNKLHGFEFEIIGHSILFKEYQQLIEKYPMILIKTGIVYDENYQREYDLLLHSKKK